MSLLAVTDATDPAALALLAAGSRDSDVLRWTPLLPNLDHAGATARLEHLLERGHVWLIRADAVPDAPPVGMLCSFPARSGSGAIELGYWLLAAGRGQGLAIAAVRQVATLLGSPQAPAELELAIDAGNAASQAVARAAGFRAGPPGPARDETGLGRWVRGGRDASAAAWDGGELIKPSSISGGATTT